MRTTPWKYIVHKSDSRWTKLRKRVTRRFHHNEWKHEEARAGNTTSGYLTAGERQGIFRSRKKTT